MISGRLRCCCFGNALSLGTFLPLNNFKFNIIALLEALVTLRLDGTIVDEHIRAVIPADKAEALCVIEPFHFTFDSRHVPYSEPSLGDEVLAPRTVFLIGLLTASGETRNSVPVAALRVLLPQLWLCRYFPAVPEECQPILRKECTIRNFFCVWLYEVIVSFLRVNCCFRGPSSAGL